MTARILVIEDQAEIRQLIRMTLEFGDYELFEAVDGDTGWVAIEAHAPDLLLLDVMMPGSMDGLELCRRLRAAPDHRHLPVILLTARGQQHDVDAGRAAGADAYLTKPFSPMELLDRIAVLLAGTSSR